MDTKEKTHFGFKTVEAGEKATLVKGVFSSVASRYDIMNDLMSGGIHHWWKDYAVSKLPAKGALLDVAGGTGDIAFRYYTRCKNNGMQAEVTVCDINQAMLEQGRNRAINRNYLYDIDWICGDAEKLPFPDNSFDAYSIAFGIRNVTDISAALKEAYRVLRPGGKFLCLEFSHVTFPMLAKLYDLYSFAIIPQVGKWVTGDKEAYQYLVESIRKFPSQQAFADKIRTAGFTHVSYENLTAGVTAIHTGWKL